MYAYDLSTWKDLNAFAMLVSMDKLTVQRVELRHYPRTEPSISSVEPVVNNKMK